MAELTRYDDVIIGEYTYIIKNDNGTWSVNVKDKNAGEDDDGKHIISMSKSNIEQLAGMVNKQQIFVFNKSAVSVNPENDSNDTVVENTVIDDNVEITLAASAASVAVTNEIEDVQKKDAESVDLRNAANETQIKRDLSSIGAAIIHKNAKKTEFDNAERAKIKLAVAAASVTQTTKIEEAAKKESAENDKTIINESNENEQLKRDLSSIATAIIHKNMKKTEMDNAEQARLTLAAAAAATDTTVDAERHEAVRQETARLEKQDTDNAERAKQDTDNAERAKITLAAAATETTVQAENPDDL